MTTLVLLQAEGIGNPADDLPVTVFPGAVVPPGDQGEVSIGYGLLDMPVVLRTIWATVCPQGGRVGGAVSEEVDHVQGAVTPALCEILAPPDGGIGITGIGP